MSKQVKRKITLVCEECLNRNYQVNKSTLTQKERLQLKKYCANCTRHTLHKETR
ncbi:MULTISPECIES: 50S ribosomal protein L33 [Mycoplasma]|uniref:Large ribosomal subunit protein bL33 n=3 Tax=Mycoplasma TaxID=2093 RepID=S6G8U1_9MOLU|nr:MULTISPECIES: 50S ribosomal protein L33 [Mycoplasma]MBY7704403.1 50S ribosomal protein L33 [Vibrio harveyi]AJM71607.1 50S ribosomal protein L33 [Mycoplasma yeatsii GM274B]EOA07245.1 50S ribosomal protein L33 [Mycoplasma yeatsii 13926]KNG79156.1 50S ribosomal protein L33 [Mycoplasma sp. HU2014]MDQ0568004.1 large subunit ribosomal protein L33 [Mycoplasma yeatsii]